MLSLFIRWQRGVRRHNLLAQTQLEAQVASRRWDLMPQRDACSSQQAVGTWLDIMFSNVSHQGHGPVQVPGAAGESVHRGGIVTPPLPEEKN